VNHLNCMTCNARVPRRLRTGALCLLTETELGLVLVDTGLGQNDYVHPTAILRAFRAATIVPLDLEQTAVRQIARLGYRPEDVGHIVLTHMHFDHCGGLPDFPNATVHVHRRELEAFRARPRTWLELAYVRRNLAHRPKVVTYQGTGERWYDFDAIRLPFEPEMRLIPLFGHTRGHCGVAVRTERGWHFHAGDALPPGMDTGVPAWATRLVLGPHVPRLSAFAAAHPEIVVTVGHMPLSFFDDVAPDSS
jgi:glyoxylase-like metal-dependent hydrolase (beta-lactamase superfamily II)